MMFMLAQWITCLCFFNCVVNEYDIAKIVLDFFTKAYSIRCNVKWFLLMFTSRDVFVTFGHTHDDDNNFFFHCWFSSV